MADNYIVLARKWRPMRFEDVVGQEHVTRTIRNALEKGKLGHGFIFAGPRGVGKTTTARLLAKAVNCKNGKPGEPCNQCESCQAINAGQHLDVIEIDGASNRGIDEIRNLRENIRFAPSSATYKVYIIDEIHMLSKEAFNALLKTLEEPPAHAIFIFATTEIHKVPLTILSRCQRFDFKRITTRDIARQLEKIAQNEGIRIESEALQLIARKSDGGMRDATSILDQISSFSDGEITVQQVQDTIGVLGEDVFFEYTDMMLQKDNAAILQYTAKLIEKGIDILHYLDGLELHLRNLLVARVSENDNLLELSEYYIKRYREAAQHFNDKDLLHYLDILAQHKQMFRFSENQHVLLELLLLKLANKPKTLEIEQIMSLLKNVSGGGGVATEDNVAKETPANPYKPTLGTPQKGVVAESSPAAQMGKYARQATASHQSTAAKAPAKSLFGGAFNPNQPQTTQPPATVDPSEEPAALQLTIEDIKKRWNDVLNEVRKEKIALASFLKDGVAYKLQGLTLTIAFDHEHTFHKEHVIKNAAEIQKALKQTFGAALKIETATIKFEEAGIEKQHHSPEEVFESIKEKEPVLKKIIELFDCENTD
jgi:DNA polymerase-3 subunit gamma/tau